MDTKNNYYDVLIVGAGLSGIGAAHHLKTKCPNHTFTILEARDAIGGTWDLFRYPGIRSDSDMYTLGYAFKPWENAKAIADGPDILSYIKETAQEDGTEKQIKFNHKVVNANWSTKEAIWQVDCEIIGQDRIESYTCNFLFMCSGYYDYDAGYTPDFKGRDRYKGLIAHPQKWTSDIDYAGKKVIVIGSGATAVTLVPEMAKTADNVIMLQRSPTYIFTAPAKDSIANFFRKIMPSKVAHFINRWRKIILQITFFKACRKWPKTMKNLIVKGVKKELGEDFDVGKHFSPSYNPWDQRMCLVPDSDLFKAIKNKSASIVTDHIDTFTEKGILLKSGKELEADIIVTATGLQLKVLGGMEVTIDGKKLETSERYCYRGMMFSDIPNLALAFGYTNASWTLKSDLTCLYVCRLLNYMDKNNLRMVVPRFNDPSVEPEPLLDFNSGYVLRALDDMPKQGSKRPWKVFQNYPLDIISLKYGSIKDDALEYA